MLVLAWAVHIATCMCVSTLEKAQLLSLLRKMNIGSVLKCSVSVYTKNDFFDNPNTMVVEAGGVCSFVWQPQ